MAGGRGDLPLFPWVPRLLKVGCEAPSSSAAGEQALATRHWPPAAYSGQVPALLCRTCGWRSPLCHRCMAGKGKSFHPHCSFSATDDPALAALCEKRYLWESTFLFDTCNDEATKQKSSITSEIVQCLNFFFSFFMPLGFVLPSGLLLSQNRFPRKKTFH